MHYELHAYISHLVVQYKLWYVIYEAVYQEYASISDNYNYNLKVLW